MHKIMDSFARIKEVHVAPRRINKRYKCLIQNHKNTISEESATFSARATCEETGRSDEIRFTLPVIHTDRTFFVRGNLYVAVPLLLEPILTIKIIQEDKNIKRPIVVLGHTDPIADVGIGLKLCKHLQYIPYPGPAVKAIPVHRSETVLQYRFRGVDRRDFNKITGSKSMSDTITAEDLAAINMILGRALPTSNYSDTYNNRWNPAPSEELMMSRTGLPNRKDLEYMRVVEIEDILMRAYFITLHNALQQLPMLGVVDNDRINREIMRRTVGTPWTQLDQGYTELSLYSLKSKIKLPWDRYDIDIEPHESWENAICCVDTPQSQDAGSILALCDGATITDGRVVPGECNLSGLLKKALVFPHLIEEKRQVMVSAITKQGVDLGHNGSLNEIPYLIVDGTEHIPNIPGTILDTALTDMVYTHEDGCIISESAAEKLTTFQRKSQIISTPSKFAEILIDEGETITIGTPVAEFAGEEVKIFRAEVYLPSTVVDITRHEERFGNLHMCHIIITTETEYRCSEGSKIAGLHSNKHIISKVWPDDKMPHYENGDPVELIISPMTIGTRLNPSLVMEIMINTYCEKLSHRHKRRTSFVIDVEVRDNITFPLAADMLESVGLSGTCTYRMRNGKNGRLASYQGQSVMTLAGPLFIMRLAHHGPDKLRIGNEIPVDESGMQLRGHGPQRLGREELEVLWTAGTHGLLEEIKQHMIESGTRDRAREYMKVLGIDHE